MWYLNRIPYGARAGENVEKPPRRSRSCCHHQAGVSETSAMKAAFDLHRASYRGLNN